MLDFVVTFYAALAWCSWAALSLRALAVAPVLTRQEWFAGGAFLTALAVIAAGLSHVARIL